MAVLEHLRQALPELSKKERKIADYLLEYPFDVQRFSCEAIAQACGTSRSAVIRLCQKMGYRGYAEFKYALVNEPQELRTASDAHPGGALQYYLDDLQALRPLTESAAMEEIADAISYANRVVTLGKDHSGLSAQQLAFRLNRFGIDCYAITQDSIMESYTDILKQGDVVIIFSISGNAKYEDLVTQYRRNRVKIILITMAAASPLAKLADHVVVLPFLSHTPSLYLLDDAVTFFVLIELIVEALNKKLLQMGKDTV